ncbi:dynamin family protein [Streptomyces sp. H28]|uniref:dynamin family protein n=1 Tax=Streptomyces sp. H28 TaxID=2775865 RepID=UPI003EC57AC1
MSTTPRPDAGPALPRPVPPPAGSAVVTAVPGWLREARRLADRHGQEQIRDALDALAGERARPVFRVAVVGEFNRGKSTLVNRLLGRDLLPAGSLPVTRSPVTVRSGPEEALTVRWPDGRRERRRLGTDGETHGEGGGATPGATPWEGLTGPAEAEGSGTAGGVPEPSLHLTVHDGWLAGRHLELVDTPGVNAGTTDRFELVRRTTAGSDAVLFVVSALSPMGLSERRLLDEEVLCRHVPFTAVVVTMLDLVDADDRQEALDHLRERLSDLPGVPVLAAPAPGDGAHELRALRELVDSYAESSGRAAWRDRGIAAQVADHCDAMTRIATEAMAAARLSEQEAAQAAERIRGRRADEEHGWEQVRIDLTSRRIALVERFHEHLRKERDALVERLRWDLERAPDPGVWWERDLPFRLRHELSVLARTAERSILLPALSADIARLDREVAQWLPDAAPGSVPAALHLSAEPTISGEVGNLSRTRLATRIGAQGGAVVGYLVAAVRAAPMPMVYGVGFSLLGGLLAESSIRSATEQQRREVDAVLVRVVDESTAHFRRQADEVLSGVYDEAFDRLHRSHLLWSDALSAAADPATPGTDWTDLSRSAAGLAARIRSALRS